MEPKSNTLRFWAYLEWTIGENIKKYAFSNGNESVWTGENSQCGRKYFASFLRNGSGEF